MFGPAGFGVSMRESWYRQALVFKPPAARSDVRTDAQAVPEITRLTRFAETVNRWLPSERGRLLWIEHWNVEYPSIYDFFMVARSGLGESRSLNEAPGHYFDAFRYGEEDQLKIDKDHAREVSILISLVSLILIGGWDAWLIADGGSVDRVELWEGNIFFHTGDRYQRARAESLLEQFNCRRKLA